MAPWVCAIALLAASLAIQEADGLYHTGSETLHWFAAAAKHHPDLLRCGPPLGRPALRGRTGLIIVLGFKTAAICAAAAFWGTAERSPSPSRSNSSCPTPGRCPLVAPPPSRVLLRVDDEGKAYGIQEPVATITKFAAGVHVQHASSLPLRTRTWHTSRNRTRPQGEPAR